MSIMGDKIHRIRDFRGMTQKQLGKAVGFDEKSADVRIAQYESGTRTPKQALVERLAEVLDINPRFLADDEILGAEGVMMMLFELDEHYPISVEDCTDEDGNKRKGIIFGSFCRKRLPLWACFCGNHCTGLCTESGIYPCRA